MGARMGKPRPSPGSKAKVEEVVNLPEEQPNTHEPVPIIPANETDIEAETDDWLNLIEDLEQTNESFFDGVQAPRRRRRNRRVDPEPIVFTPEEVEDWVKGVLKSFRAPEGYTMGRLSEIGSESDEGWLQVVKALITFSPLDLDIGPKTIALVLADMATCSNRILLNICQELDLPITNSLPVFNGEETASDIWVFAMTFTREQRRRANACVVLDFLAETLIGHSSALLFTPEVQTYLLNQIEDKLGLVNVLYGLAALSQFARTGENRSKLYETPLVKRLKEFEVWRDSSVRIEAQIGFLAEDMLDTQFWRPEREMACTRVDPSNHYVILNPDDMTPNLRISADGLEIRCDMSTFETVKATACASFTGMDLGVWYYEVELVTEGIMQIGWATKSSAFRPEEQTGVGDDANSVGYDGCRRQIWHYGSPEFLPTTLDTWKAGDIVGFLLDLNKSEMKFYLNGHLVSTHQQVFRYDCGSGFYPAASLAKFQQVKFNFGATGFKYPPEVGRGFHIFNDFAKMMGITGCKIVLPKHITAELVVQCLAETETDKEICILCCDSPASVRLIPCNHAEFCKNCITLNGDICPLCRQDIEDKVDLNQGSDIPSDENLE